MIPDRLLSVLICPQCKKGVKYKEADEALVCKECRLKYRIVDGIPDMLVEDAVKF
jgi:hypothetical protein